MALAAALAAALALALALAGARADLPVGEALCGQTSCPAHTYCSSFDHHCRPCSDLCLPASNNYVPQTCEQECQGYLHDLRYVPRDADIIQHLSRKVQALTAVAAAALVLSALLLLAAAAYAARLLRAHRHLLWRFTKRGASHAHAHAHAGKQKVGASAADDAEAGRKAAAAAAAALQLPVAGAGASPPTASPSPSPSPAALSRSVSRDVATPATTSTPLSRPRHPSEDNTLDYAYDNPALAPSPGGRKESSF